MNPVMNIYTIKKSERVSKVDARTSPLESILSNGKKNFTLKPSIANLESQYCPEKSFESKHTAAVSTRKKINFD